MIDRSLPCGYRAVMDAATLASSVIAKSPWSVLALSFHMALTTQAHYKEGFVSDREISEAFKNFLRDRWRRESRRVIFDGIEWARIDANLSANQRDVAVDDFIALMLAIDDMLQVQCDQDVEYFVDINPRELGGARKERLRAALLAAYRWQFIETGLRVPRFSSALRNFLSAEQFQRLHGALHGLTVNSWTH